MAAIGAHGVRPQTGLARSRHRWRVVAPALAVLMAVATAMAWQVSQRWGLGELAGNGEQRLSLYASSLRGALAQYDYLPFVVAGNHDILRLFEPAGDDAVDTANRVLEALNEAAGSAAVFVMNRQGLTLAASNWRFPDSFVDQNYAFRPYFQDALAERPGQYFAIGVTTGRPGFFMSHPIRRGGDVVGVVAVKVDLEPLQEDWADAGEQVLVSDRNGIVFLASTPGWRYRSLNPLADVVRMELAATRQYRELSLQPLAVGQPRPLAGGGERIIIEDVEYLRQAQPLEDLGWTVHFLSRVEPVNRQSAQVAFAAAAAMLALITLGLYLRLRQQHLSARLRAQDELEAQVAQRTAQLQLANQHLLREIGDRQRAEQELRDTQAELVQAGKLAALGQMSAGIAHEINQPLAAIQTFLASSRLLLRKGRIDTVEENLEAIRGMADRMAAITGQLKTFAHKTPGRLEPIGLAAVVVATLRMLANRIDGESVTVHWREPEQPLAVMADQVRLEQVLGNLVRNALDAVEGVPSPTVWIDAQQRDDRIVLRVRDNGAGLEADSLDKLFDPFFTTKPVGRGLGLGLSLSYGIVRDFGGYLKADNHDGGGAVFEMGLPAA